MKDKDIHLVLPYQLFAQKFVSMTYCLEEPILFYEARDRPIRTHPLRIAYMRASLRHYARSIGATYVAYSDVPRFLERLGDKAKKSQQKVVMWDPVDRDIERKYRALFGERLTIKESPMFLATSGQLNAYYAQKKKNTHWIHGAFYGFIKDTLGVLRDVPSQDAQNRMPLPKDHPPPQARPNYKQQSIYYKEAITYVQKHPVFSTFDHGHATLEELVRLPITHKNALKHLNFFIKHHFRDYGTYQDAIAEGDPYVHHAHISYLLNNGLLEPRYVLKRVMSIKGVPLNSKEGFVRQLVGWREYMRFIYMYFGDALKKGMGRGRLPASWYKGTTGIVPFDVEVQKVKRLAFAHHIVRLMVFLNLMKLHEFRMGAVYVWFMEMVSLDAYDWVMVSNLAAMGHYQVPPAFMRKPYISSSQYIVRMSDYKKGTWCATWDTLYQSYLRKHKNDSSIVFYLRRTQ